MLADEITDQAVPGIVIGNLSEHREGLGDERLDVVVEQLGVDLHPAALDAGRHRMAVGIPDVGGKA